MQKETIKLPRKVWIDADSCPKAIKEILFRAASKRELPTCLVANHNMYVPSHHLITRQLVPKGFDVADAFIVQHLELDDIVITSDLPLAALIIEKGGHVLSSRGQLFTEEDIREKLSLRNFFQDLRDSGIMPGGGPPPFQSNVKQHFASAFDKLVTSLRNKTTLSEDKT